MKKHLGWVIIAAALCVGFFTASPYWTVNGTTLSPLSGYVLGLGRIVSAGETTLVNGDFVPTGWGAGAAVSVDANSTDSRFSITVTAGTVPGLNPTIVL